MAIYHLCTKIIGRSAGRTATAAAAYRAGIRIQDVRTGILFDYSRRTHVGWRAIAAPDDSPAWALRRDELWNAVELAEKRGDAQLAREVEISLPLELTHLERLALIAEFVNVTFVERGMVADITVHDNHGNPHAHVLLTMRELLPNGFGKKVREWNDKQLLGEWRERWTVICNRVLETSGHDARIDHRSLVNQGVSRTPTRHEGPNRRARFVKEAKFRRDSPPPPFPTTKSELVKPHIEDPFNMLSVAQSTIMSSQFFQPKNSRSPLVDSSYQETIRSHFGERLHAIQYDEEHQVLDIRIKSGSIQDYGNRITAKFGGRREEVEAIVDLALLKGWKSIHIQGSEDFRRNLWREATRLGYLPESIKGYEPTTEDRAILDETNRRKGDNGIFPVSKSPTPDAVPPPLRHRFGG